MNIKKYKKIISIAMLMVIMATTFSMNAFAAEEPLTMSDEDPYDFKAGKLIVLETYSGEGQIAPQLLKKSIKTVTIDKGVRRLVGTFQDCYNLTSVIMPDTVVEIGEDAFAGCSNLSSITIKDGVKKIGDRSFMGCEQLQHITIPSKVIEIDEDAFRGCIGLESITIKDGVKKIGDRAFMGCEQLQHINIPKSVTSIGLSAFEGCTGLTSINVDEKNSNYKSIDGVLFSKDGKTLIQYPIEKNATNYIIPNSVTEIGDNAFEGCTGLTSVTIPNSVTEIGSWAFSGCTGLTSVTIPDSVTSIGNEAFSQCTSLNQVNMYKKTTYSEDSFPQGTVINFIDQDKHDSDSQNSPKTNPISPPPTIYIPTEGMCGDNVNFILDEKTGKLDISGGGEIKWFPWANYSRDIKSIEIYEGVTGIGENAFKGCTNLEKIKVPNSVKSIGAYAFYGCTKLDYAILPDSVMGNTGKEAFGQCKMSNVTYKNNAIQ